MVAYGAPMSWLGALFADASRAYGIAPMDDSIAEVGVYNWAGARAEADTMALIGHRIAQDDGMPTFNVGAPYAMPRGQAPALGGARP